jgi:nitroreductase
MPSLSADERTALVRAGVAAPSADNRHVVRFEVIDDSVRVRVAPGQVASVPDHRIAFHEIAFGAIIENLVLTAPQINRAAVVRCFRRWREDLLVAQIDFVPADEAASDDLGLAIFKRTTNRRLYRRSQRIPDAVLDELTGAVALIPGIRADWLDDDRSRARALRLLFAAEGQRFRSENLHAELFRAIRFDAGWLASIDEGLPPGALEVEAPLRPLFRAMANWKVQRILNGLGAASVLGFRAAWLPAWTAPHIVLLSAPGDGSVSFIDGGRALQRLWLSATRRGVSLQPMAASLAIAAQRGGEGVPDAIIGRCRRDLDGFAPGRRPVMLARLGYADEPSMRALRRDPAWYLINPESGG